MKNILITGAYGQVGTAIRRLYKNNNKFNLILSSLRIPDGEAGISLDVRNKHSINEMFNAFDIDVIIHLAAMTDVDGCEKNPKKAEEINVIGTGNFCDNFDGYFVYISTDYVFNGENGPYNENSPVSPINVYGATKLEGEKLVLSKSGDNLIIRSNVIYDYSINSNASFLNWVIASLQNKKEINVVNDQINNPTWAESLAMAIFKSLEKRLSGVVHWADKDILNRYEFALKIAKSFNLDSKLISPISTSDLKQEANRPLKSGLNNKFLSKKIKLNPKELDDSLLIIKNRICK